ncbi:NDP-sugar synthase [Patescibacteria group bacterium]|nr:NDP-sugar synthase [Patescibacteria group bacterium]MBU1683209.1 NDP-sugar synthase [Patescibacteria group bacterium]MBU1934574.1 NDP-sugar synthase [Patescibacteria group bacterium]
MKCIILAGGFATRLWPLTENKAKPLLHLKDKPLISHIVEQIPKNIEIIVSTNAIFEDAFYKWSENFTDRNLKIFVEDSASDEFKKGALGATAFVIEKEKIEDDLMLLAGDNYFGFSMQDFISKFNDNPLLAAYDIKDLNLARKFGVVVKRDGKVFEFQEKPEEPKSTLVSTGCYIFPQKNLEDIINYAKEKNDDLGGVFEYLMEKGQAIDVFAFDEKWYDIGSFEAYLKANKELIGDRVISNEGVNKTGENKLIGGIYLGKNSTINNCVLEDTVILNDCNIDNCVIRKCVIDEKCTLKNLDLSHKMIRQGSHIEK